MRDRFAAVEPLTVGLEEELLILDPETLDLAPIAARLPGKLEMPKAQIETATAPARRVADAIAELAAGRRALAEAGIARFAGAGAHPLAAPLGELNTGERYDSILAEYGLMAEAQLVCSLQVHVPVGERTLEVYNALRSYLPELAALAANAPFYAGRDTGLASVRPMVATLLPRQGIPPVLESWEHFEASIRWGKVSGTVSEQGRWWYELRPHLTYGTLEVRVCDSQSTIADATAVAGFVHALVAWLYERDDLGTPAETWRIAENRWAACRYGVEATFADLETGAQTPVREVLRRRLEEIAPAAAAVGADLSGVESLIERNGALRQREIGLEGATAWLADRFLA